MKQKDFQYYHERVGLLMEMYDNWEDIRGTIAKNSNKIFSIITKYRGFPKHNPVLAFNLERKVRNELNKS